MMSVIAYAITLAAGLVGGAGLVYAVLCPQICPAADAHRLDEADRNEIAAEFKAHTQTVREQLSSYADLLAGGDPQLRERLRSFETGDL